MCHNQRDLYGKPVRSPHEIRWCELRGRWECSVCGFVSFIYPAPLTPKEKEKTHYLLDL
jgi:hypothetical protein